MASKYLYRITVSDGELGTVKEIKAQTQWELELKVKEQKRKWREQAERMREKELVADMRQQAEQMNQEAQKELCKYESLLIDRMSANSFPSWDSMLKKEKFPEFSFDMPVPKLESAYSHFGVPKQSFLENIFKSKRDKRIEKETEAQTAHNNAMCVYEKAKEQAHEQYTKDKTVFESEQQQQNDDILVWKEQFENGETLAVERYLSVIIANSHYPDAISCEHEALYDANAKMAIISFGLPSPDELPQEVGYKFVATRKAIDPILMKTKEKAIFYESVIQKIALRVIDELFRGVYIESLLETIVFNGWVHGIDKSTGKDFDACILSVQAERAEFEQIKLDRIDPKECLRGLKALSAGQLCNLAPVKPIMELNREDKRFVASVEVMENLETDTNLATIPWEEFEHLVRELFSKIFTRDGCEVQVTQASRDGGVDAVAFDPDPIRGGKFVIQAKRYNNVVPVSACRDLYGTMINEGAVKGILVTTSHYGSDARAFVKDKPITLIDGANLVHMLGEYGYNFRIELKE